MQIEAKAKKRRTYLFIFLWHVALRMLLLISWPGLCLEPVIGGHHKFVCFVLMSTFKKHTHTHTC